MKKILVILLLIPSLTYAADIPRHIAVNVTTTSTPVVASADSTRKLLVLENDSDTTIYCKLDESTAVSNAGLRLNASGGSIFFDVPGTVPTGLVYCIHGGTGSKVLLVTVKP